MSEFYYNNWCSYNDSNLVINEYDSYQTPSSYIDALTAQATVIANNRKNLAMFISGGVDSQTKALGFIKAGVDIEYVTVRNIYEGKYNHIELFYAEEFCKKHNVPLTIYDIPYTRNSLEQLIFEQEYLNSSIGSGIMLQFDAMKKFTQDTGKHIVTSHGHFDMHRDKNICSGYTYKPNTALLVGFDLETNIIFDMYAPYLFKYYEQVHKTDFGIQIFPKYEAKNLSFTELGMSFRPKLSGWEFLCNGDYSKLSTLNWASDHSHTVRLPGVEGVGTILKTLGIKDPTSYIKNKPYLPTSSAKVLLYSFETNKKFPF